MSQRHLQGRSHSATVSLLAGLVAIGCCTPGLAQPVPDDTLGNERSQVIDQGGQNFEIDGGAVRARNQFHSFEEFGVEQGGSVYFRNPAGVENIFSRVTGANRSDILGTLGVRGGAANLYLMNPNGILFGENARLDVQGSFVGTTANAIGFGDRGFFSATNPEAPSPLLNVAPSAFFFSQLEPATIENRSRAAAGPDPFGNFQTFGLRVPDGEGLLLLGGDVNINSGGIVAFSGRINIGGLAEEGVVNLNFDNGVPSLGFPEDISLSNVSLTNEAGLLVRADGSGEVIIRAENLSLSGSSSIQAGVLSGFNTVNSLLGSISLIATEDITITSDSSISNTVDNGAQGNSGDIRLSAENLVISGGSSLDASTYGKGSSGNIDIVVEGDIRLEGIGDSRFNTLIINRVFGGAEGDGGNVNISSGGSFLMTNNAQISVITEGVGDSGDVVIEADETVSLSNATIFTEVSDGEVSGSSGVVGDGGDITVRARRIFLTEGSQLRLDTENQGNAGNAFIFADESLTISGRGRATGPSRDQIVSSGISSTVEANGVGEGGDINITVNQLAISDGGLISASTSGTGSAGVITIQDADSVNLDRSTISTTVDSGAIGNGGNIDIYTRSLSLTNAAQINASTEGQGRAGDITIETRNLTTRDSGISASTFGDSDAGNLTVHASNSIRLSGEDPNARNGVGSPGGLFAQVETSGTGNGGILSIETDLLSISDGSKVQVATFGDGDAGELFIQADEINIFDTEVPNRYITGIFSGSEIDPLSVEQPDGSGGNLTIRSNQLSIRGGEVSASTSGTGNAGNIDIEAQDSVELVGSNSLIASGVEQNAGGRGGDLAINTRSLSLSNGAEIRASTSGQGDAGDITIRDARNVDLANSTISTAVATAMATGQGGDITVGTETLNLNRATITSSTSGGGNTGTIDVQATDRISLTSDSSITNEVEGGATGNSQQITLSTPTLSLRSNSTISAATNGNGVAGDIRIQDANTVSLSNSTISTEVQRRAEVSSDLADRQGNITIDTQSLFLTNNADITASTNGEGDAGNITVRDAQTISLDDNSSISTQVSRNGRGTGGNITLNTNTLTLDNARINAQTRGQGRAGDITVTANTLEATNGGQLISSTTSDRAAGAITLRGLDNVTLDGRNSDGRSSGIFANTNLDGQGGAINIRTSDLSLNNRAAISSASRGSGQAGNVDIQADDTLRSTDSDIITSATNSSGGSITISGGNIRLFGDADIRTDVGQGTGSGGNITVDADSLVAFDDSDIIAAADDGQGGNISFGNTIAFFENYDPSAANADPATLEDNDRADLNATGAIPGLISLPDTTFIQNSLNDLPDSAIDADSVIANSCIARTESGSTFLVTGSGGLPPRPGVAPLSPYPTGTVRTEVEAAPSSWQPGDEIVEPQGVYQLPDGQLVMSRECNSQGLGTPIPA